MMKKSFWGIVLTLIACVCLCFGLTACGEKEEPPVGDNNTQTEQGGGAQGGNQSGGSQTEQPGGDKTKPDDETRPGGSQTPSKKTYDMSAVVFANVTVTYNGEPQSILATNLPEGVTVEYEGNGKTNAGTYTVTAHFTGDEENYKPIPDKTAKLTIKKAVYDMGTVAFSNVTVTYNKQPHSILATGLPKGVTVEYEGNGKTNAGTYTVTAHFMGEDTKNYELIADRKATLKIEKAEYDMSAVTFDDLTVTYDGSIYYVTAKNLPDGMEVSYDNNRKSAAGDYIVTAHFTGDSQNYKDIPDRTAKLSIVRDFYDIIYHFVGDGVENDNPTTVSRDAEETPLLSLECRGYEFVEWCSDEARGTPIESIPANPRRNYHLYAKWVSPFRIVDGTLYTLTANGKAQEYLAINNGIEGVEVTKINARAFNNSLATEIVLPDSVTEIGERAFYNCGHLESLTTPVVAGVSEGNGFTRYYPFGWFFGTDNSSDMDTLYMKVSATARTCSASSGGSESFNAYVPTSLCRLTIHDATLGKFEGGKDRMSCDVSAFYNFSMLTSVWFGKNVISIGHQEFYGCTNLSEVHFENPNVQINSTAFANTAVYSNSSYRETYREGDNQYQGLYRDGVLLRAENMDSDGIFKIKPGTVAISGGAFATLKTSLKGIEIPDSVISIGYEAFSGCSGLTGVYITDLAAWCKIDFENASANPFCYAKHLYLDGVQVKNLTIPVEVTGIKKYAFYNCSGLESVTIGSGVTSIDEYAFYGCSGLTKVYIADLAAWCQIDFKYDSSNPLYYAKHLFLDGEEIKNPTILVGVTAIKQYVFYNCEGLESVTIGSGVTSIDEYAFYGCSRLESVTIGSGVTKIGERAFASCSGLESVTIPDSVKYFGSYVFQNCTNLTDLIFEAPNGWQKGSSSTAYSDYYYDEVFDWYIEWRTGDKYNFSNNSLVAATDFTNGEYEGYYWRRVD